MSPGGVACILLPCPLSIRAGCSYFALTQAMHWTYPNFMPQQACTYLDNAATSWPKPDCVAAAMTEALAGSGNPGRAAHRLANNAARIVYQAREAVAALLGVSDPLRVVFGPNATWALNLVLRGLLRPGDHVVTTSVEHNSVMRPLRALEREGVQIDIAPCDHNGQVTTAAILGLVRDTTRLIVMTHASNVTGALLPAAAVAAEARGRGVPVLLDAAQTAGAIPIDMDRHCIDFVAFSGHKSLCGPMGSGGLAIGTSVNVTDIAPLVYGGTGSRSERQEQPEFLPDRFESGTPNVVGLAGLAAGVRWVLGEQVAQIRRKEQALTNRLLHGLSAISGLRIIGPFASEQRIGTVSFTLEGFSPSEIALRLDEEYGVLCRAGLHCSPASHRALGTFPDGTVRLSLGPLSTDVDVDSGVEAVAQIARTRHE